MGGTESSVEPRQYVAKRFDEAIAYYWRHGARNKRAYKWSRLFIIVLGSLVTLLASLSSAAFLKDQATVFAILTPVLAALLTTVTAFSQSFQWGAAWREMIIAAEQLAKERDRIAVTPDEKLDLAAELQLLNDLILMESRGFFDRLMGSSIGSPNVGVAGGSAPAPQDRQRPPPSEPEDQRPALPASGLGALRAVESDRK